MPDLIIIGGGLTGLAAAWECERRRLDYTLIEVKPRLGGAIHTETRAGFVLDRAAFIMEKYGAWDFLEPLGLNDAMRYVGRYRDGRLALFKQGTQALIDALAATLTRPVLRRMAVSSVGQLAGGSIGVCLENGLMLDARGVIITVPARYAPHLIYDVSPQAALLLDAYMYEHIARVHLGYRRDDLDAALPVSDAPTTITYIETYDYADRVPPGHVLVRAGVRLESAVLHDENALIAAVRSVVPTRAHPVMSWVAYWAEADPLTRHLPEFPGIMDQIDALLPPTIALAGSDYRAKRIEQQVRDGRRAVERAAAHL